MSILDWGLAVAVTLFLAMIAALEAGRRLGLRRQANDPEGERSGTSAIEGAVFALLGLLIAFTFTGASSRFDARRHLVVEEANAIGTAWLRLDLLPAEDQPAIRDAFRAYVDARLDVYRLLPDVQAAERQQQHAVALQGEIWSLGCAGAVKDGRVYVATLLLPALNQVFDISSSRVASAFVHVPELILAMLIGLALLAAFLAGHAMATPKGRSWLHILAFAFIMSLTIYVIVDLEFPRMGLIRMDSADRPMLEMRDAMK